MVRAFWSRLRGLLGLARPETELDAEIEFHLAMLTEDQVRRGVHPRDARAAALRHFGGITQMKEAYRDQQSLPAIEMLVQDVRYGLRSLWRTPGFTAAALLTLALGIGANAAIFSVVHAVLLRPLPYPEPDRIVQLTRRFPAGEFDGQTGLRYMFFRDHLRSVEALAAWRRLTGFNLASGDSAEYVQAMPVSKEYFHVFGVRPLYGEVFRAEHDTIGGPAAVVLDYRLWKRLFNGDPSVIGQAVSLGSRSHTVLGVLPESFVSIPAADLYVPLRPSTTGAGGGTNYVVGGRLRPELTLDQATAEAAMVMRAFADTHPSAVQPTELPPGFLPFQRSISREIRPALLLMLGAVGMLLLIACANTANLLLARASGRGREIAVRAALGAGRARIVRQLLTESVLLSFAGGLLGLLLAYWAVPLLLAVTPPSYTIDQPVRVDATVTIVVLGVSLLTGLLFGLAPALSLSRHDLVGAFKDDGTRTTSSRRSAGVRNVLVVGEVALCMLLLVGAGLLIQTFIRLRGIDPGFDTSRVLTARMSLQGSRYAHSEDLNRFFDQALERIARLPGVQSAAVVNSIPIDNGLNLNVDVLDGPERIERALTDWRYASPLYFQTMGIAIIAGRGFSAGDRAGAPPVAVVNEEFARRFFKGTNALGHHIKVFKDDPSMEIVGIAKDVRERGLVGSLPAVMYVPVGQANFAGIAASHTYFPMNWVVRANRIDASLIRAIRDEVRLLDPGQPFSSFQTMDEVKAAHVGTQRFQMTLLTVFAGVGLLLATAGIYGLISYSVAQRTREFGIRLALGATRERVLGGVLRQGATLALAGVLLGTAASLALARTLDAFVYGVRTLDPATFVSVGALLVLVASVASLLPAVRAVRLNPIRALRE